MPSRREPRTIATNPRNGLNALFIAARKNSRSKSDPIRTLLASGKTPAEIAEQVGCSRNLVYVVKGNRSGGKKRKARRRTRKAAPRSKSAGRPKGGDDLDRFVASVKELERERDELRAVVDRIRQLVSKIV